MQNGGRRREGETAIETWRIHKLVEYGGRKGRGEAAGEDVIVAYIYAEF